MAATSVIAKAAKRMASAKYQRGMAAISAAWRKRNGGVSNRKDSMAWRQHENSEKGGGGEISVAA